MIQIKDNFGVVRAPKPGEKFTMKDGRFYTVDRSGALRVVKADQRKQLTPGKQRRKERRAAELNSMRRQPAVATSRNSE